MSKQNLLYVGPFVCESDSPQRVRNAIRGYLQNRISAVSKQSMRMKLGEALRRAEKGHQVANIIEACLKAGDVETIKALASLIAFFSMSDFAVTSTPLPRSIQFLAEQLRVHAHDLQAIENIRTLSWEVTEVLDTNEAKHPGAVWHNWCILQRCIWALERSDSPLEVLELVNTMPSLETEEQIVRVWGKWSPKVTNAFRTAIG